MLYCISGIELKGRVKINLIKMVDRYKGTQWRNFKLALKRGFTYGLALELMFIGSGYLLYREYTTNRGKKRLLQREQNFG